MSEDKKIYNEQDDSMPFTGHDGVELYAVLEFIHSNQLSVELFDAFLAEYARTKCLKKSLWYARSEWDT